MHERRPGRAGIGKAICDPSLNCVFHDVVKQGSPKERQFAASVPVKRLGVSADVPRAVPFFADVVNGFTTGQVLYVCGGTSVGSLAL